MRKKISPKLFKNKKRVWIIGGIGFLVLLVLGFNLFAGGGKDDKASESPTASKVTKGQLASSTLLTGMVKLSRNSTFILTIPLDAMPL